jgi:hypothetical protein
MYTYPPIGISCSVSNLKVYIASSLKVVMLVENTETGVISPLRVSNDSEELPMSIG